MPTIVISFIIVLGVLIFIHELGHFAVAKLCGVRVEKFSLGFGPRLFGIKRGDTDYFISALPLGGYVKMTGGEHSEEEVPEELKSISFPHKSVYQRAAIVAAGPIMNLILAFVLLPVIFMIGIEAPAFLEKEPVVGHVAKDMAGSKAGFIAGDVIRTIDGKKVSRWEEVLTLLVLSPGRPMTIDVGRAGATIALTLTPDTSAENGAGYAGIYPETKPVIGGLSSGYPAFEAGIKPGDMIVSIDGAAIRDWAEIETFIHKEARKRTFVVEREGKQLTFELTPKFNEEAKVYLVGISRKEEVVKKSYGFIEAVEKGIGAAANMVVQLFQVIKGLVVGQYSLKTLGGPILIAQVAGKAAQSGITATLWLMAFLSLQLGVINLFPLPVLDGGHLLFFAIERIKGSPISEKALGYAQQVGVALLITLMVLVTYNDILRLFA